MIRNAAAWAFVLLVAVPVLIVGEWWARKRHPHYRGLDSWRD